MWTGQDIFQDVMDTQTRSPPQRFNLATPPCILVVGGGDTWLCPPFVACLSKTFLSLIILFIQDLSPFYNLVQSDFSSLRVFSVRKKMHQIMKTHWARFEITSLGGVFMWTNSTAVFSECLLLTNFTLLTGEIHFWWYGPSYMYTVTCQPSNRK